MSLPAARATYSETSLNREVSKLVSIFSMCLPAMAISSMRGVAGALPDAQDGGAKPPWPRPERPPSAFAVAMPKSLWVCISMWILASSMILLISS